jgi:glycosyltransferase involved in cell wall biosynthesis
VPTSAITVSYFGVHQAFQLALAAQELGLLDVFFCSLYDAPGKWGGVLSKLMGGERLVNRRCAGFDATAAVEIPGPLLCEKLRLLGQRQNGASLWPQSALTFDRAVARRLDRCASRLFVGVETCAAHSFARAKALGWTTVLDYPGIGAEFLDEMARQAADDLGLPPPPPSDSPAMRARKQRELELADHILVCSEFQRRLLLEQGVPSEKLHVIPLWADPTLWFPAPRAPWSGGGELPQSPRGLDQRRLPSAAAGAETADAPPGSAGGAAQPPASDNGPLRVLFAGSINLRKGVPYLLRAVVLCGADCELTLVGALDAYLTPLVSASSPSKDARRGRDAGADDQPATRRTVSVRHGQGPPRLGAGAPSAGPRGRAPLVDAVPARCAGVNLLPPQPKAMLRQLYWRHDVLVLPSLGDSFGFVAMEAMACGLPVIVSEHCGVPVPDASWRVPVMNADAIAERLQLYARDRALCRAHGRIAAEFAASYTPERYRAEIKTLFRRILGEPTGPPARREMPL